MKTFTFNPLPIVPANYAEIYNNDIVVKAEYTDVSQYQQPERRKRVHTYASFVERSFVEERPKEEIKQEKQVKTRKRGNSLDESMKSKS